VSLLCILFEDLGCAIKLHEEFADDVTEQCSLDPKTYLFNGQEEGDDCNYLLFEQQGIINDVNSADKEYLKLYESWCVFAYREFYKILLAILDELSFKDIWRKDKYPKQILQRLWLHNDERIHAYLMKVSNNNNSDPGFSYVAVMNSQTYIIPSGITRPHQFSLGNIPTMSGITDSIGEGWDTRKISKYFKKENNIANQQEEVPMTTSKQFDQAYIMFSTMKKMKLTMMEGNGKLFTIECYMPSFEPPNKSVCKQHASMFKNDNYTFNPHKDLVLFMPYQFIANLKPGQFTPLDNQWLKNLNGI
jgi:hypothetical protein